MRMLKPLFVAGALAALPVAANAQWYAGIDMGVTHTEDSTASGSGVSYKSEYDNRFDSVSAIHGGYAFGQYKLEGEFATRSSKTSEVDSQEGGGTVSANSLMINGVYEFLPDSKWHPFVGLGIGTAFVDAAGTKRANNTLFQGNEWVFAYQGFVGVAYDLFDMMQLTAQYRYFGTTDYEVAARSNGAALEAEYGNHAIMIGMNYKFGVTPAPVAAPAPAPVPVAAPAPAPVVKPAPAPIKNFLVFFDFNKSDITPEASKIITQAVDTAKKGGSTRVDLTGHADRSGPDKYNMALSLKRANAVKAAMVKQGIPADQISVVGKGETQPLVQTPDGVREPQNRRVEIVLP